MKLGVWYRYFRHRSQNMASEHREIFSEFIVNNNIILVQLNLTNISKKRLYINLNRWFTSLIVKIMCNYQVFKPKRLSKNQAIILNFDRPTLCFVFLITQINNVIANLRMMQSCIIYAHAGLWTLSISSFKYKWYLPSLWHKLTNQALGMTQKGK